MTTEEAMKIIIAMNNKFLDNYKGTAEIIALLNNTTAICEKVVKMLATKGEK